MTDYKSTLNLPKTPFPMRGNLPVVEPEVLKRWAKSDLSGRLLEKRKKSPPFILHDGPPYANGDIHMGHALNKVLKDFVIRYQSMKGSYAPYVPGWDCHGLPIEFQLMKELGVTKHEVDRGDFRRKARAYALKYVDIQREQFKRLGLLGDWDHPYLTLKSDYVAAALRTLGKLVSKKKIYRERRPVNWCWVCETALAEAEVEYEDQESPSIYVKFQLNEDDRKKLNADWSDKPVFLVIWTTTPWTLIGNVAVAVHPKFQYAAREVSGEVWITAEPLPAASQVILRESGESDSRLHGNDKGVLEKFEGRNLEGLTYQHPFGLREGSVVLADYVSMEEGTGLVHTAPGFGAEDYATGKKYGLEIVAPVSSDGKFIDLPEGAHAFEGQQVQKANPEVIAALKKSGHLIHAGKLQHTYPHCWRCHNPIIFRATGQWFLSIDRDGLREKLIDAIQNQVKWIPAAGQARIKEMVASRPDWCLSRQRLWGIPIPAIVCTGCKTSRLESEVIENFAETAAQEEAGMDLWFTEPVSRWLPKGFKCSCGSAEFKAGEDILDVWFDSGVSHQGVLLPRPELNLPADLYLEGSDQHRGWFQVSLITGVALEGQAPYKAVLTHGFVVDGQGRKMSKSLGNVISEQEIVKNSGADLLRLWVAVSDYREDIRLSKEILSQVTEEYRKIRNTIRFCLANVADFDPTQDSIPIEKLESSERWVLSKLAALTEEVTGSYDDYAYHRVARAVHAFCTLTLSNFYLDVIKDRLYTSHPNDPKKRSAQTALFHLAETLIKLIAPILPVTADEAWRALSRSEEDPDTSVHLQDWPEVSLFKEDLGVEGEWTQLLEFRDQAMKVLEKIRAEGKIGDPLEAQLQVTVRGEIWSDLLEKWKSELPALCVVSQVNLTKADGKGDPVSIDAQKAPGQKCQRCWMRLPDVGSSARHPELCGRCVSVIDKLDSVV